MNLLLFSFKSPCPSALPNQYLHQPGAIPQCVSAFFLQQMHRLFLVKYELPLCLIVALEWEGTHHFHHFLFKHVHPSPRLQKHHSEWLTLFNFPFATFVYVMKSFKQTVDVLGSRDRRRRPLQCSRGLHARDTLWELRLLLGVIGWSSPKCVWF